MIEERAMEAFIKELKITSANYSDMLRKLFSIYFIDCQILIAQLVKAQKIIQRINLHEQKLYISQRSKLYTISEGQ
jgi:hypothetical protein